MTSLKHPNITPPLVIDVPDADTDAYKRAGWVPVAPTEPEGSKEKSK